MVLHWTIVHAVIWTILYSFTKNIRVSPCAKVNSSSEVVPFGTAVTASCYIKEECQLQIKQDFLIKWKKNNHFMPSSKTSQKNVNEIHISNFTDKEAVLECFVCDQDNCNVVGGVKIRTVYPPPTPQNLTCQLNLKDWTLRCMWDTGIKTSDFPTNYTLYTQSRDIPLKMHVPLPEENFFKVPRDSFPLLNEMQVYVVATNAFGQATSNLLVVDPIKTAKLDAPVIQGVGAQSFGCFEYKWSLSRTQTWIQKHLHIEIKMKPVNEKIYNKEQFTRRYDSKVKVCGLLHGMSYESQMRVRYHKSSPWSEWSNATVATTPMKAPTGRLVTWLKPQRPEIRNQVAQLFWKPSLQFRANSMNVSYIVSLMGEFTKKKETACVTVQQSCSFQIHAKVRKVYLTAMNEVGKANPTEVSVYRRRGMDPVPFLKILPQTEESLLVQWKSPDTSAISEYVLEWKALCGTNSNHVSFEIMGRNQTSFVVSGLEPYIPYEISLYPKYGGGIGRPYSTMEYTKEKAPSISPKLEIGKITPTLIEVSWNEIPLNQRNGLITGYRIFYSDEKNNTGVIDALNTTTHMVLKDLYPFTIYELFLMTSTNGGSVNGSTITVKTVSIDAFEIFLIVIPACVGLVLLSFALFACFGKQTWMKKYLWPVIPDPANSNIKKWTAADSLECMPPFKEVKDPVLMYLSHVSLLSLPEKELLKGDKNIKSGNWSYNGKSVDAGHDDSSNDSKTFDSEQQSESVPYATVVFAGSYRHQPVPPPVYLRSESTQPLLGEEEPSSPRSYEKMSSQSDLRDVDHFLTFHENLHADEEKASLWGDFPMLRSLEINTKA